MLELFVSEYRLIAQDVLAFSLIAIAFVWGGGPERAVAAVWLFVFELGGALKDWLVGPQLHLTAVDPYLAAEDMIAGVIWITIALYANRNYTLWVAAMQVLAMTAHVARGLVETLSPLTYIVMTVAPGWFQLFFLAIGIARHVSRKRKYGPYRDWRLPAAGVMPSGELTLTARFLTILGHDFFSAKGQR